MTHKCKKCGSNTESPGLCPVCLEMEARGVNLVEPFTGAEMDEIMKDIANFLFPEGER